ncbi:MAG: hypothetical protein HYV27_05505 [Candidatus Hydrogenedentes bacterium]|nr:hypothetical protein [Candidatus Hydrogenedentota bacterium]
MVARNARHTLMLLVLCSLSALAHAATIDLSSAVIVTRPGEAPQAEQSAAIVLMEEIAKRTGLTLPIAQNWPAEKTVIAITSTPEVAAWNHPVPQRVGENLPESHKDGYRIFVDESSAQPVVWIIGADPRGTLYGVGALLRKLEWADGRAVLNAPLDIATAPQYPIRGHQLGYRQAANSYDAWSVEQYDQFIRELTFFGVNSIENIPFQDSRLSPVMKVTRPEMNRAMSAICQRYGLDYWVWTAAEYDLADEKVRAEALDQHEALYKDCPELTGVFFPGGDPGENPPELVLPFLEDNAKRLLPLHPDARIWLSLQWFNKKQIAYILEYIQTESPDWLGGLVAGPSAPPIPITRTMLPEKYQFRDYPDLTHNKICQYPVPWWDQAFALTLGREAINPRPTQYAMIHNWFAPYTDGFISYSDGAHDDVNKTIWSAMSWDSATPVRDVLVDYSRVFLDPALAEDAADGILALEKNWRGPLVANGAVEGTLLEWQRLEKEYPRLAPNWRWQMFLVRAYYDAYVRRRLLNESELEREANAVMAQAAILGADRAIDDALEMLQRVETAPVSPELRARIVQLSEDLWQSIGLQSSVKKYRASGAERGCFLDFVDYPLNNRWWLEDEFSRVRALPSEAEKIARLVQLATWENPGPGSCYDDIGNTAKSPHVLRSEEVITEPGEEAQPGPMLSWWDEGMSRARLSWQCSMSWPEAVVYEGLEPKATYVVRTGGYGQCLLKIDGERVQPTVDGKEMGEFKEFPVPPQHYSNDRKLVLTFDAPTDEGRLNWRQHSRLSEMWLLKQ